MLMLPRPPARPAMRDGRDEALAFDLTVTWMWASLGLGLVFEEPVLLATLFYLLYMLLFKTTHNNTSLANESINSDKSMPTKG